MSNWAFMKPFPIHGVDGSLYLWRLRMIQTPWFAVYLHAIHRPDHDQECHDHPWNFVSFVLRGSYTECVPCDGDNLACRCRRKVRWFNWKRAEQAHRITDLVRSPTWTLVFTGRRRREWGFYVPTEEFSKWVPWHEFLESANSRAKVSP